MTDMLKSKKWVTSVIAALVAGISSHMGLEPTTVLAIISPFLTYIGAQGAVDVFKCRLPTYPIPPPVRVPPPQ